VIRIIREEDEPKQRLIARFTLSDLQAEAILNMRLRSLRRLEEMEIRREHKGLTRERKNVKALLGDVKHRWARVVDEIEEVRAKFGSGPLGGRRTEMGDAPVPVAFHADSFVEREAITVVLSDKGWIRAVRGHAVESLDLKFKEGDRLRALVPCLTTDRVCLFGTNGRAYTLKAGDLPRGRGDGQPVRLLADLANEDEVARIFIPAEGGRYLVASSGGRGFVVPAAELAAEKRTGKQILNLRPGEETSCCAPVEGDHVAVVGENRKLLVFPLAQVPEMVRGAGVMLQKYRDGGLADAKVFRLAAGLTWKLGEKLRTEANLRPWLGERGQAGRQAPNGFPKSGKFS
jgi:topoisomerase-4 subunit A